MEANDPNYLVWFLVIFFAVTLGNLTSSYITARRGSRIHDRMDVNAA